MRPEGRAADQLRPVTIQTNYILYPEGSVLISQGNTRVLCNVTIEEGVPQWMRVQNRPGGWLSAEYAMLPRATHTRTLRETNGLSGRTQEIKRLIARSLRAGVNLAEIGPRTLTVDCDVLQADGGTRTAAITGGYVAVVLALSKLIQQGLAPASALLAPVAAVSVGMVNAQPYLDLCYKEDSWADVDMNVVMTGHGEFIEVQGTSEKAPFSRQQLDALLSLAEQGIHTLFEIQAQALSQ